MNKYLLLRDNKQSGPYTVPELIEKGIKAYDLVWLDGKSVAWRYPSEIEELKAYSPAVEEQPFDRFYRRPEPVANTAAVPLPPAQSTIEHSAYVPKVTVTAPDEDLPPQKKVYINFPATPSKKTTPEYKPIASEKKSAVADPVPEPVNFTEKTFNPPVEKKSSYSSYNNTSSNKNHVY